MGNRKNLAQGPITTYAFLQKYIDGHNFFPARQCVALLFSPQLAGCCIDVVLSPIRLHPLPLCCSHFLVFDRACDSATGTEGRQWRTYGNQQWHRAVGDSATSTGLQQPVGSLLSSLLCSTMLSFTQMIY